MLIRARAPLRLGIAGGGTDVSPYCERHGGVVLNASVDLYAYAILQPLEDGMVNFQARDRCEEFKCNALPYIEPQGELVLHKGVYNRMVRQFNDGNPLPVKLTTYSDAAAGSGLGTSSTMVVVMIKAFVEWLNLPLGEYDIAHMAYEIERMELGLAGGKQDQYSATFGGFNFMEFYDHDRVIVNPLRIKNWIISELECSLVLYYTGGSRQSAEIIKHQIANGKNDQSGTTEALHRMKDDAFLMKECLLKGQIREFGEYLDHSWEEKKKLSAAVSNPGIDEIYQLAKDNGAYAGKVSGAGGGGFMMFLTDPANRMNLIHTLTAAPGIVINCHFTKWGTQGWRIA